MRGLDHAVIVCDDVRREVTGKDILIGVYSGDIILSIFPMWFPASLWIEIETLEVGKHEINFRMSLTDKPPIPFKAEVDVIRPGSLALFAPGLQFNAEKECELLIEVLDEDGWRYLNSATPAAL
jgi:hypothetical protein